MLRAMSAADTLRNIHEARAIAILRANDREIGRNALAAAVRAGFRVLEVTLSTPGALDLIAELADNPNVLVGCGTVLSVGEAREAVRVGARFLVSPVVDPDVIAEAVLMDTVAIPGCSTPTELWTAHKAGAQLQKLFPAPAGGPAWLKAVLAPMPFLKVVPTNGVDESNAAAWLASGAFAVGCVRALFHPEDLGAHAFDRVEARARTLLSAVLD